MGWWNSLVSKVKKGVESLGPVGKKADEYLKGAAGFFDKNASKLVDAWATSTVNISGGLGKGIEQVGGGIHDLGKGGGDFLSSAGNFVPWIVGGVVVVGVVYFASQAYAVSRSRASSMIEYYKGNRTPTLTIEDVTPRTAVNTNVRKRITHNGPINSNRLLVL